MLPHDVTVERDGTLAGEKEVGKDVRSLERGWR